MEKILDYGALAPLLREQLRPGVATNAVLSREDYVRAIAGGGLDIQRFDGGLYLFLRRNGFSRLCFYAQQGVRPPAPEADGPLVMEIARRERDTALAELDPRWEGLGFARLFRRLRLKRPADAPPPSASAHAVRPGAPEDQDLIEELLERYYDRRTGCLPAPAELAQDLARGQVWLLEGDEGFLHIAPCPVGFQVRHIAVDPGLRRRGCAQSLLSAALTARQGQASLVWIRDNNVPSLGLFQKNSYVPDGWTSSVWLREG